MAGTLIIDTLKSSTTGPVAFQNTSGTEIGTLCRAWVNFNGSGTVAIRASFNVSSITDNGTGDYTVNFTNALSDANYATTIGIDAGAANYTISRIVSQATTSVNVKATQTSTTGVDVTTFCVSVFR